MKPGTKAFWRPDLREGMLRWLLLCAWLLACGPAAWAAGTVVHYTQAEMLRVEAASFKPLAATVDDGALSGSWTQVALPRVIETPAASDTGKRPVVTTWLRIHLDALQGSKGPTHFYLIRWLAAGQIAVYADGRLRYRSTGSPVWNLFSHPALLLPLNLTADSPPPKTLLIRLDSLPSPEAGISSFYAGDSDSLVEMAAKRDWLAYQLPSTRISDLTECARKHSPCASWCKRSSSASRCLAPSRPRGARVHSPSAPPRPGRPVPRGDACRGCSARC